MTRLERIQKMSAEEMAEFLDMIVSLCSDYSSVGVCTACPLGKTQNCDRTGITQFLNEEDDGTWI